VPRFSFPRCENGDAQDIPDDTVPVTAFLKELLSLATAQRPLLIFFDSIDELTGSQVYHVYTTSTLTTRVRIY
jgi:hypothetical protein